MTYNSGRNARSSMNSNGTEAIMVFEDTKVFLCNKARAPHPQRCASVPRTHPARPAKRVVGALERTKRISHSPHAHAQGIAHWGNLVSIVRMEAHDVRTGSMLFGSAGIADSLINARSQHPVGTGQMDRALYSKEAR
jgi:hypothetical protein